VPFPTKSESGIRYLLTDHREAGRTGIWVGGELVLVTSLHEARAALQPNIGRGSPSPVISSETPVNWGPESGVGAPGAASSPEPSGEPHDASKAPESPTKKPGRTAIRFLEDYLSAGPQASTSVIEAAQVRGISLITLRRAKRPAGVLVEPVRGDGPRVDSWVWRLAR
jgi:hypothetical protein